jgi:aminopeptidase N
VRVRVYTPIGKKHLGQFGLDVACNNCYILVVIVIIVILVMVIVIIGINLDSIGKVLSYFGEYYAIPYPLKVTLVIIVIVIVVIVIFVVVDINHLNRSWIKLPSLTLLPEPWSMHIIYIIPPLSCSRNWGLVTYRETALLVDPNNSGVANRQRVAYVVAHECMEYWY